MRRFGLLLAIAAALICAAPSSAQGLRVFLSTANPGPLPPIPNPAPPDRPALAFPPEFVSQTNPTITGIGTTRVYIWAYQAIGGDSNTWQGLFLNIDADGPATLSNLTVVNPNSFFAGPSLNRWLGVQTPAASAGSTEFNVLGGILTTSSNYGVRAFPPRDGYSTATQNVPVLFGWFDVTVPTEDAGSVWIEIGDTTALAGIPPIWRQNGNPDTDPVFLGFGDASILGNFASRNSRTALPDLTIIDPTPPPGPFTLSAPVNNTFFVAPEGTFVWTASAAAASYTLEIDNNADFSSPALVRSGITTTTAALAPGDLPVGAYHARVRAINPNGTTAASPGSVRFALVPACPADGTANGSVGLDDIAQIINSWGTTCP